MNDNCKCCSGLCIDLLTKFEDELGFTYELVRTNDPKWGTFEVRIEFIDILFGTYIYKNSVPHTD